MGVAYREENVHYYACTQSTAQERQECRWVRGADIDAAVGKFLLQSVTSGTLELALSVQDQLTRRIEREEAARHRQLELARRVADRKRQRFLNCDPDHRLVADTLEADWNEALRQLDALQQQHQRQRQADTVHIDSEVRARLLSLAENFPRAWNDPRTGSAERRRMLDLLVEDVTLMFDDPIAVRVRLRGGQTTSLSVPRPQSLPRATRVPAEVIKELDRLLESYPDHEVAACLNALGYRTWAGNPFTPKSVDILRQHAGLKTRFERLRAQGFLTASEMSREIAVSTTQVYILGRKRILSPQRYGSGKRLLFAPLDGAVFVRGHGGRYRPTQPRLIAATKVSRPTRTHRR
jgi:hypothetical protein